MCTNTKKQGIFNPEKTSKRYPGDKCFPKPQNEKRNEKQKISYKTARNKQLARRKTIAIRWASTVSNRLGKGPPETKEIINNASLAERTGAEWEWGIPNRYFLRHSVVCDLVIVSGGEEKRFRTEGRLGSY